MKPWGVWSMSKFPDSEWTLLRWVSTSRINRLVTKEAKEEEDRTEV